MKVKTFDSYGMRYYVFPSGGIASRDLSLPNIVLNVELHQPDSIVYKLATALFKKLSAEVNGNMVEIEVETEQLYESKL
jgi:hypothetical protein